MTPEQAKERGVKVKPLVWCDCETSEEAKGVGAKYKAYEVGLEGKWNCVCYPFEGFQYIVAKIMSKEEALAAAQADHERRILEPLIFD